MNNLLKYSFYVLLATQINHNLSAISSSLQEQAKNIKELVSQINQATVNLKRELTNLTQEMSQNETSIPYSTMPQGEEDYYSDISYSQDSYEQPEQTQPSTFNQTALPTPRLLPPTQTMNNSLSQSQSSNITTTPNSNQTSSSKPIPAPTTYMRGGAPMQIFFSQPLPTKNSR